MGGLNLGAGVVDTLDACRAAHQYTYHELEVKEEDHNNGESRGAIRGKREEDVMVAFVLAEREGSKLVFGSCILHTAVGNNTGDVGCYHGRCRDSALLVLPEQKCQDGVWVVACVES